MQVAENARLAKRLEIVTLDRITERLQHQERGVVDENRLLRAELACYGKDARAVSKWLCRHGVEPVGGPYCSYADDADQLDGEDGHRMPSGLPSFDTFSDMYTEQERKKGAKDIDMITLDEASWNLFGKMSATLSDAEFESAVIEARNAKKATINQILSYAYNFYFIFGIK